MTTTTRSLSVHPTSTPSSKELLKRANNKSSNQRNKAGDFIPDQDKPHKRRPQFTSISRTNPFPIWQMAGKTSNKR